MALLECIDCGYPVSSSAAKCPKCGRVDPTSNTWFEIIFTIVKYAVKLVKRMVSAISGSKNESQKSV
jgi:RNA polymerase subunit RPABC4/transcription elongation factor Spt4